MTKNINVGLSIVQAMALSKMTNEWQSAYSIRAGLNTLNALVRRGLIEVKYPLGSMAFPRTTKFRRK